jgi:hypothetical protein
VARILQLQLDENELKMLLVAVRQVKHTLSIAEAQSQAAGEPLDPKYQGVQESYDKLERKVQDAMETPQPFRIK